MSVASVGHTGVMLIDRGGPDHVGAAEVRS